MTLKQNKMENGIQQNQTKLRQTEGITTDIFCIFFYICVRESLSFNLTKCEHNLTQKSLNCMVHFFYECGSQSNRNTEQPLIYGQCLRRSRSRSFKVITSGDMSHSLEGHIPFNSEISFALTGRQRGILLYSN